LNGIGQTLGSLGSSWVVTLGRMLGPVFSGSLFSWAIESHVVDYRFSFAVICVLVVGTFCVSLLVNKSIDQRAVE